MPRCPAAVISPPCRGVERQLVEFVDQPRQVAGVASTSRSSCGGPICRPSSAARRWQRPALQGRSAMEFDDFWHGGVELGDAFAPGLVLALKIVARAVEDQDHAGSRVACVSGQQGAHRPWPIRPALASSLRFRGGALPRGSGRFRRARPDHAFAGEQRHRARIVQHLASVGRPVRAASIRSRAPRPPTRLQQRLAALPPPVDLRAEEQVHRLQRPARHRL